MRILLVEDHDINRRLIVLMLEKLGHRADCVNNGQEALQAVARGPYQVILMDCQMPILDGYEAARQIRQREARSGALQQAYIIAITAHAMVGDREKCLSAGMDDYLTKPLTLDVLRKALEKAPGWTQAAPAPPPPPPPPALPPETQATLDAMVQDFGPEAVQQLVASFLKDVPERVRAMATAVAPPGDPAAVGRVAHSLKGTCSIFGLRRMEELALELEGLAQTGQLGRGPELCRRLELELAVAVPALRRLAGH